MYVLMLNTIYYVVMPVLFYYFFCLYCRARFSLLCCLGYVVSFVLLMHYTMWLPFEIVMLAIWGSMTLKGSVLKSFMIAALIHTIYSVCNGFVQTLTFWLFSYTSKKFLFLLEYGDSIYMIFTILFMVLLLLLILKRFGDNILFHDNYLLLLLIPILFISVVEKMVSNHIYGDTIVLNDVEGIVFPVVNHIELLFLQLIALLCIFTSLIAYRNITKSISAEQAIQQLKQQNHLQQIYTQEAQMRYEQTRSFRHDIQNHLTVLSELLKRNQSQAAYDYLYHLEDISKQLSFSVQTGNVVIDALLSSKFAMAKQKEIAIEYHLKIPENIEEMDLCIVLANALDNAIKESTLIEQKEKRYICITGSQKGNFYLLSVKNNCHKEMEIIQKGIGLCNVESVCQKYRGTIDIEYQNSIYQLNMLFVIPQQ